MKLTQIRVAGLGAWPHLELAGLSPQLNVLFGRARSGKSTVAALAAHLLYGKSDSPWRQQFSQTTPLTEGSLDVASAQGNYVLRRHRDGTKAGRLTVASAGGASVDGRVIRTLLGGLPTRVLGELFAVDFAEGPQPQALLTGEFAQEFTRALDGNDSQAPPTSTLCAEHQPAPRRQTRSPQIDELVKRRDEIVRQLESQMAQWRRGSASVEQEIAQLDQTLAKRRAQAEDAGIHLHAVEAKLAEVESDLRYFALETQSRPKSADDEEQQRQDLAELDQEIERCRKMLGDLQARDAAVRRELAKAHPDGTAEAVGNLIQQRATVSVLERLLDDLDAEVANLARSHEPARCIAADAHARMSPVARVLRQQVYALCGQLTEQERSVRRTQLRAEVRQLARAQSDVSEQLEHLLERRQELVYHAQLAGRVTPAAPQPAVGGHCQCDGHDAFLQAAGDALVGRGGRTRLEEQARIRRDELERQRVQLRESREGLDREIAELTTRWQQLQRSRTSAAERDHLNGLRSELDRLEAEINRSITAATIPAGPAGILALAPHHSRVWKASDVLAQLTAGQLTQIRMSRENRAATIVDREGRLLTFEDLTPQQNDQLYLALTLALVSSLASRGTALPLVLDEPFLRQDAAAAAAMVGVLAEFAREGSQVLVFTEDSGAVRRFETLEVKTFDIDVARRTPAVPEVAPAPTIRVVRETIDGPAPRPRPAAARTVVSSDRAVTTPVYYLTVDASLADFPVLGNDTALIFSSLGLRTVEDLLAADAADVARRLAHPAVTSDAVKLWQQHTSLMCFVPGVSLADAQVLAACDVTSPEALFTIDTRLLAEAVVRFLATERGRRFGSTGQRLTRDRLAQLQKHARRQRDRWQLLSPRYGWVERTTEPRTRRAKPVPALHTGRRRKQAAAATPRVVKPHRPRTVRFLLDRTSPVSDAPAIGAKMAERLGSVGIRSVADLLNTNPESTAGELESPSVTAEVISRWQCQARLACRIPELRGIGAQLLVACGFTEPEHIAGSSVAEVLAKIKAVCRTRAGKRILRDTEVPTAARVAAWIRNAAATRSLDAA